RSTAADGARGNGGRLRQRPGISRSGSCGSKAPGAAFAVPANTGSNRVAQATTDNPNALRLKIDIRRPPLFLTRRLEGRLRLLTRRREGRLSLSVSVLCKRYVWGPRDASVAAPNCGQGYP